MRQCRQGRTSSTPLERKPDNGSLGGRDGNTLLWRTPIGASETVEVDT